MDKSGGFTRVSGNIITSKIEEYLVNNLQAQMDKAGFRVAVNEYSKFNRHDLDYLFINIEIAPKLVGTYRIAPIYIHYDREHVGDNCKHAQNYCEVYGGEPRGANMTTFVSQSNEEDFINELAEFVAKYATDNFMRTYRMANPPQTEAK